MSTFKVPYYEFLVRLASYQKEKLDPVNFRFLSLPGESLLPVLVQPILETKGALETLPLFNLPNLDPIRLWMSFDYINLTSGGPGKGEGEFLLTEKALGLELLNLK